MLKIEPTVLEDSFFFSCTVIRYHVDKCLGISEEK